MTDEEMLQALDNILKNPQNKLSEDDLKTIKKVKNKIKMGCISYLQCNDCKHYDEDYVGKSGGSRGICNIKGRRVVGVANACKKHFEEV